MFADVVLKRRFKLITFLNLSNASKAISTRSRRISVRWPWIELGIKDVQLFWSRLIEEASVSATVRTIRHVRFLRSVNCFLWNRTAVWAPQYFVMCSILKCGYAWYRMVPCSNVRNRTVPRAVWIMSYSQPNLYLSPVHLQDAAPDHINDIAQIINDFNWIIRHTKCESLTER